MDLRRLRYFVAIQETGSFSQAASRLHIVQSALSTQIQKLEASLGVQLFVRDAQGVRPTAAGARLLVHARDILDRVAAAERDVKVHGQAEGGVVRIGIPSSISRMLTVPLLKAVEAARPRLTLQVVEVLTAELESMLLQDKLDIALLMVAGEPSGSFESQHLRNEPLYLVGHPDAAHDWPDRVPIAALDRTDLILPTTRHGVRQVLAREAAQQGLRLRIKHELDSIPRTVQLIAGGAGASVMLVSSFVEEWRAGLVAARLLVDLRTPVTLRQATARGATHPAVAELRRLIRETAQRLTADGTWPDGTKGPGRNAFGQDGLKVKPDTASTPP
ncbi:LysR family transcriptional regulator [Pigmentiphaga litoralis]|uniref:LysR family transcriptional regulator n=1 Tax=Pigmentiphaga litoralis TaxID=516702 RepID=UPI003B43894A